MHHKLYIFYPIKYILSNKLGDEKMSKPETETITLTVTVEMPKKVHKLLERFCAFTGVSLEEMLLDELNPNVKSFWQNEVFQDWLRTAIEDAGCADYFQIKQGETE